MQFFLNSPFFTYFRHSIYLPLTLHFSVWGYFLTLSSLKSNFFWKTANYSDAYWFLYNSKALLYTTRNI